MKTETKTLAAALGAALVAATLSAGNVAAQDETRPDPAQLARGAKAWADNCGRCHNIRAPKEVNDQIWEASVTHMRVRANIPGNVAEDIKVFLKASN